MKKKLAPLLALLFMTTLHGAPSSKSPATPTPPPAQEVPLSPPSPAPSTQQAAPPSVESESVSLMNDTLSYENMFIKTILALVGLLLVIFFGIWILRKLSSSRSKQINLLKSVKILEKRPISPKSMLYLIEVAGRKILISESQLEVRPISNLEWLDVPPTVD